MKFFATIQRVDLDKTIVLRAWDFAKKVIVTTDYSDSNQTKVLKIKDDHFVSKLGEEACKKVMEKFAEVEGPDYTIYSIENKSWADDLLINKIGVAVKTQRQTNANKYSLSWTFQCGKFRRDNILNNENAWVMFVNYDDTNPYRCYVYPPYQIKELVFKEPRLAYLKDHKKVIYAQDLKI